MENSIFLFDKGCVERNKGDYTALLSRDGGVMRLPEACSFPILFVLQGGLSLHFGHEVCRVSVGTWSAIDYSGLVLVEALPHTVVMYYVPPSRLQRYLANGRNAFHKWISSPILILAPLKEWIDELLEHLFSDQEMDEDIVCSLHHRWVWLLMNRYTPGMLNELYVSFYVYSQSLFEGDCGGTE